MPSSITSADCPHFTGSVAEAQTQTCAECASNFNLRMCTECGHVGCCESQQAHNTAHAKAAGHPVIVSYPMDGGHWTWCYTCNAYLDQVPARAQHASA